MDLLSCLPTDIIVLAAWTKDISETNAHTHTMHSIYLHIRLCVSAEDVMRTLSMSRLNRILRAYKLVYAQRVIWTRCALCICKVYVPLLYFFSPAQPLAFNYLESQVGKPVGTITYVLASYM